MSLVTFDNLKQFFEGLKTKPLVFSGDINFNGTTKYKNNELATKTDLSNYVVGDDVSAILTQYAKKTDLDTKLGKTDNAASASKIGDSTIGSASTPVYIDAGVPAACTSISVGTVTATKTLNIPNGKANFIKDTYTLSSDDNGALSWTGTSFTAPKVYNAVYNDYAEYFQKGEKTEVGDIISLDLSSDTEQYVKADDTKNTAIVGVHSDSYGHLIGGDNPPASFNGSFEDYNNTRYIPIALCGRVLVKVKGIVHRGEYIIASDIPGIGKAVKPYDTGLNRSVGIALEDKLTETIDKIKVKII